VLVQLAHSGSNSADSALGEIWILLLAIRPHFRAEVYSSAMDERTRIRLTKYSTKAG
jgi:hypothetical protein